MNNPIANEYTLRIWIYPFSDEGKGFYIKDFNNDTNPLLLLSKDHIDVFINDKNTNDLFKSKDPESYIKNLNIADKKVSYSQLYIFLHHPEKEKIKEKFDKLYRNLEIEQKKYALIEIANGNKSTSINYGAMNEAIELYNNCEKDESKLFKKGIKLPGKEKLQQGFSLESLSKTEPEVRTNWKEFFEKTGRITYCKNHNYYAFVKGIINYQLINLNSSFNLFKKHISSEDILQELEYNFINESKEEDKSKIKKKLNIIFAPFDLTKNEFSENLFKEIIQEGIINIDDSDSILKSNSKENKPLLLICDNAGKEQNFYNASIWSRMINLNRSKYDEIKLAVEYLTDINNQKLYQLEVTREYIEFQTRLYKNSYLTGSHNNILPITFHDEENFENLYNKTKDEILELIKEENNIEINVLLIDDFAQKNLFVSKEGSKEKIEGRYSKKYLLEVFKKKSGLTGLDINIFPNETHPFNNSFKIDNIVEFIKETKPDIILMDYNLGNNIKGSQIFKELIEENNYGNLKEFTPFEKLWIFPITTFSNAFIDEIRADGLGFIDDKYRLTRGADFICTPNLFKYYFSKIIFEIIKKSINTRKSLEGLEEVLKKIDGNNWSAITTSQKDYLEKFTDHLKNKKDYSSFINIKSGIIGSLKKNKKLDELNDQHLNFYEQLLYNLAYRNFEGNEEIIIFYDLLKKTLP